MDELLAPFHPRLVHFPIALIVVGAIFELVGRITDLDWWRRSAFAMLVIGVLAAGFALSSGEGAAVQAWERQGVPREPLERHETAGKLTFWVGALAVLLRLLAGRLGALRSFASGGALALHLAAAGLVVLAGFHGGKLVYEHGAGVRVDGELVPSGPVDTPEGVEARGPGSEAAN